MLNIQDLERRWLRYTIKRYIPIVLITSLSIILVIVLSFVISSKDIATNEKHPQNLVFDTNIKKSTANILQNNTRQVDKVDPNHSQDDINNSDTDVMTPSMTFLDNFDENMQDSNNYTNNMQNNQQNSYNNNIQNNQGDSYSDTNNNNRGYQNRPQNNYPQQQYQQNNNQRVYNNQSGYPNNQQYGYNQPTQTYQNNNYNTQEVNENSNIVNQNEVTENPNITIDVKSSSNDIQDVIKRFENNKSPVLSLFLAKYYYSKGNYKMSKSYSLVTNELDSNIDESWILFVKSLMKLGDKKKAKKTLTSYIKHSNSLKAKELYKKINKGKFK